MYSTSTAPLSDQLKQIHLDKRVLPMFNDSRTRNVSVEKKFYETIQPVGQNFASKTQSFLINSSSNTMISLSESYFVATIQFTKNATAIPPAAPNPQQTGAADYSVFPFASSLFLDQIRTRISNVDVSDQHPSGLYSYGAFHKSCLTKESEVPTSYQPASAISWSTNSAEVNQGMCPIVTESLDASTVLECLPMPYQSLDHQIYEPAAEPIVSAFAAGLPFHNTVGLYLRQQIDGPWPVPVDPIAVTKTPTGSGALEMIIKPKDGIWQSSDYLPTNVQMIVDLALADMSKYVGWEDLLIEAGGVETKYLSKPTIALTGLTLYLCRVQPKEDALLSVNEALNVSPFTYPLLLSRTESYQLAQGLTLSTTSTLNGIIPNAVIIQLVSTNIFVRNWNQCNPFSSGISSYNADAGVQALEYPTIRRLWLTVGSETFPRNAMYLCNSSTVGFNQQKASYNEYRKMCIDEDHPYLSFTQWSQYFQLFCFNLVNDDSPFEVLTDMSQSGNVQVNIEFGTALPNSYTMILTALQQATVTIDKTRSVQRIGY